MNSVMLSTYEMARGVPGVGRPDNFRIPKLVREL